MSKTLLQKSLTVFLGVLFAISAIILVAFSIKVVPIESQSEQMVSSVTDIFLMWSFVLFVICLIVALAFPIIDFITNLINKPKSAIKIVALLVFAFLVVGISYSLSSDSPESLVPDYMGEAQTPLTLLLTDTGLITLYITLGLSFCSIVWIEVTKLFK